MSQEGLITLIYKRGEKEDTSDRGPASLLNTANVILAMALRAAIEEIRLRSVESLEDHLILKSYVICYGREGNMFPTLSLPPSDVLIKYKNYLAESGRDLIGQVY